LGRTIGELEKLKYYISITYQIEANLIKSNRILNDQISDIVSLTEAIQFLNNYHSKIAEKTTDKALSVLKKSTEQLHMSIQKILKLITPSVTKLISPADSLGKYKIEVW
jgi:hypothetical protein